MADRSPMQLLRSQSTNMQPCSVTRETSVLDNVLFCNLVRTRYDPDRFASDRSALIRLVSRRLALWRVA